jgi:hypothetical protein
LNGYICCCLTWRGGKYLVEVAQPVISLVGNDDAGLLGVDGGVGEVGRVSQLASGDGLEEGRFTNVGETDL